MSQVKEIDEQTEKTNEQAGTMDEQVEISDELVERMDELAVSMDEHDENADESVEDNAQAGKMYEQVEHTDEQIEIIDEEPPERIFKYEPLPPNHIRLISVWGLPISLGPIIPGVNFYPDTINCRFEIHHIDDLPEFDAISYAWGAGERTGPIECMTTGNARGCGTVRVTRHLWTGLATIMRKAPSILCWLDFLSINQDDIEEKQQQIPLMTKIYGLATNVVVWLGEPEYEEDLAFIRMEELPGIYMLLQMLPAGQVLSPLIITDPVWQRFALALKRFDKMPWFSRSWVCQEAILAQNLILLYGPNRLSWEMLYELWVARYERSFDMVMMAEISDNDPNKARDFNSLGSINELRSVSKCGKRPIRTDRLINLIRNTAVTKLSDKVYGILGLLAPQIGQQILVDYSQNHERVWLDFARAAITHDVTLSLLANTSTLSASFPLPSWCPDLSRGAPDIFSFMDFEYYAGFHDMDKRINRVTLLPQGMHIKIPGFRLGTVKEVAPLRPDWGVPSEEELIDRVMDTFQEMGPWLDVIDDLVRRALQSRGASEEKITDATWRVHIADAAYAFLVPDPDDPDAFQIDPTQAYYPACDLLGVASQTWFPMMRNRLMAPLFKGDASGLADIEKSMPSGKFGQRELRLFEAYNNEARSFGRRRIFSTENGLVGMGPVEMQEGDIAVVLYDAGPIFILRPIGGTGDAAGKECFKSVGDGYVYGCMTLAKTSEEFRQHEEEFIIG